MQEFNDREVHRNRKREALMTETKEVHTEDLRGRMGEKEEMYEQVLGGEVEKKTMMEIPGY